MTSVVLFYLFAALAVLIACAPALAASNERIPGVVVEGSRVYDPERDGDPVINNLERRTFRFFWDTTNKRNGMAPDRWPSPSFASTAGIGFALTAYVIGAERGFVSRGQARLRTLRTLRFLATAPPTLLETVIPKRRSVVASTSATKRSPCTFRPFP